LGTNLKRGTQFLKNLRPKKVLGVQKDKLIQPLNGLIIMEFQTTLESRDLG